MGLVNTCNGYATNVHLSSFIGLIPFQNRNCSFPRNGSILEALNHGRVVVVVAVVVAMVAAVVAVVVVVVVRTGGSPSKAHLSPGDARCSSVIAKCHLELMAARTAHP